jgi:hypothetical protein
MEFPTMFQSAIVKRALGNKFDAFNEQYQGAKLKHTFREPTDKQHEMAEYAKKHGSKAAATKFKVPGSRIYQALDKVGRYYWLNSK